MSRKCTDTASAMSIVEKSAPSSRERISAFDFVRTVADCEGMVTDSFHGLQFAACFVRPFVALGDIGAAGSNVSRLVDFCARFGISDGMHDISGFRSGGVVRFADMSTFNAEGLAADRAGSLAKLKAMLP